MKKLVSVFCFIFIAYILFADVHVSTQPHFGQINDMEMTSNSLFTVGQDGYVINWKHDGTGEHYQISDLEATDEIQDPRTGVTRSVPRIEDGKTIRLAGMVTTVAKKTTKNGDNMAIVTLEDM